jgi:hypothetical protein
MIAKSLHPIRAKTIRDTETLHHAAAASRFLFDLGFREPEGVASDLVFDSAEAFTGPSR